MADQATTPEQETDAFEVVTAEAVVPEDADGAPEQGGQAEPAQEPQGDESANAQAEQERGQEEGPEEGKEAGQEGNKADADGTGEEASRPKSQRRFQKRIDRLTKRAAEAERRAAELEAKLQQGEGKAKQEPEERQASTDDEPDPAEFDSYDDYLDALTDWKAAQKSGKPAQPDKGKTDDKGEQAAQQDEDQAFTEALEDVQESFAETRQAHPDFDEVIAQPDLQITRDMVVAMADAEDPGGIAYYLGTHKDEAARIAGLSAVAQAKEIGKLEAKLAQSQPPSKKTTQAPDPIEPVRGSDSAVKDPRDMDFHEYEQAMNARENRGGGFW